MKLILSGLLALILIFSACEKIDDQVVSPNDLQKYNSNSAGITPSTINFSLIPLPQKSPIYLDSVFTVSKLINGLLGGAIVLDRTYISDKGQLVTMLVNLVIPPLSFLGQDTITVTIDNDFAAVHCEPGMTFLHPLLMLQTFTGLNLSKYNTEDIDFVYINDEGGIEDVENSLIIVNKPLGLVTVIGAQLHHFSRYGWVRKHDNSN